MPAKVQNPDSIFSNFDDFVAKHKINLDRGPKLGDGGASSVHRSGDYAVRRLHPWHRGYAEEFITTYVNDLYPGLGVDEHLEQLEVASLENPCTVSRILPGIAGNKLKGHDLGFVTDDTLRTLFKTFNRMQAEGLAMDRCGSGLPSGNILFGRYINILDFTYDPKQSLAEKFGCFLTTLLSNERLQRPSHARLAIASRLAELGLRHYGTRNGIVDAMRMYIDKHQPQHKK